MHITKNENKYYISDEMTDGCIAKINAPIIVENDIEAYLELELFDKSKMTAKYKGKDFFVADAYNDLGDGLFAVERTLLNEGNTKREVKLGFEAKTCFTPSKYLIPCINYNGNEWGDGMEPKGLECEGEPWVFSYDRVGIPSCSITENKDASLSVFASCRDKESLRSSCSMIKDEDGMIRQRILWPVTEAPYTYSDNDKFVERYDEYITLDKGESFKVMVYILTAAPRWENYAAATTFDRILEIFSFEKAPNLPTEKIWEVGIEYAQTLMGLINGDKMIAVASRPLKEGGLKLSGSSEIGWAGQCLMQCRMLLLEYVKAGNGKLFLDATKICDNWVKKQADNGLILARYNWYKNGREWDNAQRDALKTWASDPSKYKVGWPPETCNMGWAASEMIKIWALLENNGVSKPSYKEFAVKICDFFIERYSPEYGFGKTWNFDGECEDKRGTIGGFITMALIDNYKILGDERYLECAKESLDFYFERDIDNFVCTAGAIDCICVDKETAGPLIIAALDLYDITGDDKYVEYALKASYYFCSWLFHYDAYYGPENEFYQYGYYTSGATSVSTQHPALDQWGVLMCPEFLRLYKITGDERWKTRSIMIWYNSTQCITTEKQYQAVHGMQRPVGAQNEAFYQCRWGHRADCNERGHLNDLLVSWVSSFRLNALDRLITVCGEADWSIFD